MPDTMEIELRRRTPAERDHYIVANLAKVDVEAIKPGSAQWPLLLALIVSAKMESADFPDADTERAVLLGASMPGSIESDIAALPADKAFQP